MGAGDGGKNAFTPKITDIGRWTIILSGFVLDTFKIGMEILTSLEDKWFIIIAKGWQWDNNSFNTCSRGLTRADPWTILPGWGTDYLDPCMIWCLGNYFNLLWSSRTFQQRLAFKIFVHILFTWLGFPLHYLFCQYRS